MYESDSRMHQYDNVSGYQETHGEFVKQAVSKRDIECPKSGPVQMHGKLPCVEHIWDAYMQDFNQVHQSIGPLFALFGTTQDIKRIYPLYRY